MWEHELPKQGFRCIAYDRRGFGLSDQPYSGYDHSTLADDLNTLIEALDLQEVTLVGFSMGGGGVVRYLSRHGSRRISKAVLVSSVTPFMKQTGDNPNGVPEEKLQEIAARQGFLSCRFRQAVLRGRLTEPSCQ